MHIALRSLVIALVSVAAFGATYPLNDGYVTDTAGILDGAYHDYLEKLFTALDAKTSAQIMIAVVPSLSGEDLAPYNIELFKKWNVGRAGKDNGVLFLIAVKERRMRIQTGHGLKDALPDAAAKNILHNTVRPLFKSSKMTDGITDGAEAIVDIVVQKYKLFRSDLGVTRPVRTAKDAAGKTGSLKNTGDNNVRTVLILISALVGIGIILLIIARTISRRR